jgi:hypothetical protein
VRVVRAIIKNSDKATARLGDPAFTGDFYSRHRAIK